MESLTEGVPGRLNEDCGTTALTTYGTTGSGLSREANANFLLFYWEPEMREPAFACATFSTASKIVSSRKGF